MSVLGRVVEGVSKRGEKQKLTFKALETLRSPIERLTP